jgi:hypothetical protein
LLRFLKELNRLFVCLFRSIPKLMNVMMILILFLVLFSILGTSLFGTSKFGETFNTHGNFRTFLRGFVTLLRASTGEAWNEIMHDLAKTETDWFREGEWCTTQGIWKDAGENSKTWDIMEDKCFIREPNACGGSWNPLSYIFWVMYTVITLVMMLNVVVAVILEGYEEGRATSEEDKIDACVEIWKKYDKDRKLRLPLNKALLFIMEVEAVIFAKREDEIQTTKAWMHDFTDLAQVASMEDLAGRMKLKDSRAKWQLTVVENNEVTFLSAAQMILRLNVVDEPSSEALLQLDATWDQLAPERERREVEELECRARMSPRHREGKDLIQTIAAIKVQRKVKAMLNKRKMQQMSAEDA